ncbi:stage V sporulation protein M [Fictibacillus aquaticus]|uniref:Stage V sporulation protein M n=2 Tax=Fictibacillus TaxID=1329200 RepID=A0A235FDB5_9BACL|nr:stage V sporulation protein M [Fictibacillus aquaticus]
MSVFHYNVRAWRRGKMKFYTIKLPKFLGGFVRAILGSMKKG